MRRFLIAITVGLASCAPAWATDISGFSPAFGQPGNVVTITGSGFTTASLVEFNNNTPTPADFIVVSDSELQTVVPIGATTGPLEVVIGATDYTSATSFQVAPVVTNFSPNVGTYPTMVAMFGANFVSGGTTVIFSGTNTPVSVTYVALGEVEAVVPKGAATGPVTVITSAGTNLSTVSFTSGTGPSISGFSPEAAAAGTNVLIYGGNFFSPLTVYFHGVAATANVTSTTEISATVPIGATAGPISVTTSDGTATSTNDFATGSGPIITNFSPTIGNSSTLVTIGGENLSGVTSVTFNGKAGTLTGYGTGYVEAYPPNGAGTGPIKVSGTGGSFTTSSNFSAPSGPLITDFSPVLGAVGAPVTIDGLNFLGATGVKFGGVSATFDVVSGTQISAKVSSGAVTGAITVLSNALSSVTSSNFTVTTAKPAITGISPSYGVRGESVTISGDNFTNLTAPVVQFNSVTGTYQTPTSTTALTATVPAGATTGYVAVNNSSGLGVSSGLFYLQPWITTNTAGGIVGSTLNIAGRSLTNASSVTVNGINYSFTNSPSMIGALVPSNATTGLIEITTPGGIFISTNSFDILPKVYSFSPSLGPAGTIVTIDGTSLFNVTSVEFGGVATAPFSETTNEVQVYVPGNAASGPITVFTPYGSSVSSNSFMATKPSLLVLTKTVSPEVANVGSDISYTLTVTNEGPSITTSLSVTDALPDELTVVSSSVSVGTIVPTGGNLIWTFPILSNNASATAHIVGTSSVAGTVTNIARLGFAEGNLNVDRNFAFTISYFVTPSQKTLSATQQQSSFYVSWPATPADFSLEVSTNLTATNGWQMVTSGISTINGVNYYTNTITGSAAFYRLIH